MIDWKQRIKLEVEQNGEEKIFIDLQGVPQHKMEFNDKCKKHIVYEDYEFTNPIEPPDKECINFGLSINDQIFRKTYIPSNLKQWKEDDKDFFIDAEWFRRENGIWIFIKGKKYYIPGVYYFFLNYWTSMTTPTLFFRYCDLEFFWMWLLCVLDVNCLGLISFKCRQVGETEKAICIMYEYITRSKNSKAGMQSIDEDDIKDNAYARMVHAHGEMMFFMKATHRGNSDPADGLFFDYQREQLTKGKMIDNQKKHGTANVTYDDYKYPPLNASIEYGPTKPHVFGTGTYRRYFMDEFGKFDRFSPLTVWNVVRQAMFSRIQNKVLGKALFTSTVEEMKSGDSLKWSKLLWNQSDIKKRTGNGMTLTGLYRIFRGASDGAHTDHWGFPMKEEAIETIKNTKAAYISTGDMKGLIEYTRMNALSIDDVFKSANQNSNFDVDKLAARQFSLDNMPMQKFVRGNLRWMDDDPNKGIVIWEPNSKGRWAISGHPKDFNCESNAKLGGHFRAKPGNVSSFCMGVDPYEQKETTTTDISMGGIAVKAKLNHYIDAPDDESLYHRFTDESKKIMAGDPVDDGINFKTNRYVCSYLHRWKDPNKFYEDVILTAVYYGTEFLPEKNKAGGLLTYLDLRSHELYLMQRPTLSKNAAGKTERDGVTATDKTIDEYFGYLMTLSCQWANTIDLPDILDQLLTMNWDNRGEKDLGVAVGWCEYASKVKNYIHKKTTEMKSSVYYTENYV